MGGVTCWFGYSGLIDASISSDTVEAFPLQFLYLVLKRAASLT